MTGIAFYAPMKAPDDPTPSGDRTMARALLLALRGCGAGAVYTASRFCSRDEQGDSAQQKIIAAEGEREVEQLGRGRKPSLWVTYHCYYKAPDILGPRLSSHWGIPYVLVEASRSRKRLAGPYAGFAALAEAACDAADLIFYMTDRDREALESFRPSSQRLCRLRPFLALETLGDEIQRREGNAVQLIACAMFRAGDKLASYKSLAAALSFVKVEGWHLTIVGDGAAREAVKSLFAIFGRKVTFAGLLAPEMVTKHFANADLLVWPGVGEAFGMVYLEAQAQGCPILAEDRPGVRDVVRDGGWLVPPEAPWAFASQLTSLIKDRQARLAVGRAGRAQVAADHLLPSARTILSNQIAPLVAAF